MEIILASTSPRRKMLLEQAGFNFKVITADTDETVDDGLSPGDIVANLALRKAKAVSQQCSKNAIVIGADTIVFHNNKVLGKPKTKSEAYQMLKALSSNSHSVYTGIALVQNSKYTFDFEETRVYFRNLSDEEILAYIDKELPLDKAGSYGIQDSGALFVEKIEGDYYNVVGLPICKLSVMIKDFIKIK